MGTNQIAIDEVQKAAAIESSNPTVQKLQSMLVRQ
jgi:hypothetical protein